MMTNLVRAVLTVVAIGYCLVAVLALSGCFNWSSIVGVDPTQSRTPAQCSSQGIVFEADTTLPQEFRDMYPKVEINLAMCPGTR